MGLRKMGMVGTDIVWTESPSQICHNIITSQKVMETMY
jgi:hypothetical protein